MRKIASTVLLALLAILSVTAAVFLAIDGNLARLTGWYHFRPGMPLFSEENTARLNDVCWMRIRGLHDTDVIECAREKDGSWWIVRPFRDRLDPHVIQSILAFTAHARVIDTLPARGNLREYGVETTPHTITLKVQTHDNEHTTIARYTLGSSSPWLADAGDGQSVLPTTYLRTDFYGKDKRIHVVSGNILNIFRDGLEALRDPHPLQFTPDSVLGISLQPAGKPRVELKRASAETRWNIVSPNLLPADQDKANDLVADLLSLSAVKVDDPDDISLPQAPDLVIELTLQGSSTPLKINIYPAFPAEADGQLLRLATVNGRSAVFTLQAEPKVVRKGSYARIINTACRLPVLPSSAMGQIRTGSGTVYANDLPVEMGQLRSLKFADIDDRDVERVAILSRYTNHPLCLIQIPGDADSEVEDTWMVSAEGKEFEEAEKDTVRRFLKSIGDIPVAGFMEDLAPGGDASLMMAKYGLDTPDYALFLKPRSCVYRMTLFGVDLPLVKDRSARCFYIARYQDPQTGKGQWLGMEKGGQTVYKLSAKFTRLLSLRTNAWRKKNLVSFPISALRRLTLGFQQAPLVLDYDYIGETWKGTMGGEDVTPRINTHRAGYYVRQLQKAKVSLWLDPSDREALSKLRHPVFSVKLDLEIMDYSDTEDVVIDPKDAKIGTIPDTNGSEEQAGKLLEESGSSLDEAMRRLALKERPTQKKTITIEIAPSDENSDTPFFYGRIRETGALFILPFQVAQGLAGSLLDT